MVRYNPSTLLGPTNLDNLTSIRLFKTTLSSCLSALNQTIVPGPAFPHQLYNKNGDTWLYIARNNGHTEHESCHIQRIAEAMRHLKICRAHEFKAALLIDVVQRFLRLSDSDIGVRLGAEELEDLGRFAVLLNPFGNVEAYIEVHERHLEHCLQNPLDEIQALFQDASIPSIEMLRDYLSFDSIAKAYMNAYQRGEELPSLLQPQPQPQPYQEMTNGHNPVKRGIEDVEDVPEESPRSQRRRTEPNLFGAGNCAENGQ